MSITREELKTIGNERTGRNQSQDDIDKFIKSCVSDLSVRGIELEAEESEVFVDSQPNYSESSVLANEFKKIAALTVVDSAGQESEPLDEISWQRYKERVAAALTPGKPIEFTRFGGSIYFTPPPLLASYPSFKVSGTIYHIDSAAAISFGNRFREALSQYVIFKIYEKYGLAETKGKTHAALYLDEVSKLIMDQGRREISRVRYKDI